MSAADLTDPFVFMNIDERLSFDDAKNLTPQQRSNMLAENPVAANEIFHKRIDSQSENFLFGKTRPFDDIRAYFYRIEINHDILHICIKSAS